VTGLHLSHHSIDATIHSITGQKKYTELQRLPTGMDHVLHNSAGWVTPDFLIITMC